VREIKVVTPLLTIFFTLSTHLQKGRNENVENSHLFMWTGSWAAGLGYGRFPF
jgi:hypothetical protein